jgi:energy-coupling factor transporter ATP-binding protein EcfA2
MTRQELYGKNKKTNEGVIFMAETLGQKLLKQKVVTDEQLAAAVARQRFKGGRLGHNLVELGYITAEELNTFFQIKPELPKTVEETGLDLSFIGDLIMKHILYMGDFKIADVAEHVKLPHSIVDIALETLRREKFIEVKGAAEYTRATYNFTITGNGKNRAGELLEICRYVGPAPVTLEAYKNLVEVQTIKNIIVNEETVKEAFSHLILSPRLLRRLGPAISSGKAMFIYGPAGNGKTTIAETIGGVLPGTVYMPHAIIVGGQIITIFDPVNHIPVNSEPAAEHTDHRWIKIKRPVIMTGGELTLKTLDLDFNAISKFYEASLQMKANNGLFIVDDFGRQQMDPQNLLNRWIVPLERRTDFMTLHTGMKFDIPFDQIVIFATNLEPKNLVDEAFLRRIRYKIKIDHPTEDEYEAIFIKVTEANGIPYKREMLDYLIKHYYKKYGVKFNACHPRDIVDHIIDDAHYYNRTAGMNKESIDIAWENYFVEM